jgi:hypothetical protein
MRLDDIQRAFASVGGTGGAWTTNDTKRALWDAA